MAEDITNIEPPEFNEETGEIEVAATDSTDDAVQTPSEEPWTPKDHFNIEEYPEEWREKLAPVITKMKQDWDKKSRAASDYEKQFTEATTTLTQLQQIAKEVISDTSNEALSKYRSQYGIQDNSPTTKATSDSMPSIPEIDWSLVTDQESFGKVFGQSMSKYQTEMADYVKNVAKSVADEVRRDSEYKFQQLAQPIHETKWTNAFKTLRDKYGENFSAVEREVAQAISQGPYRNLYGKVDDQKLLEDVFKAQHSDRYHEYLLKQERTKLETKKSAETEKPRKSSKVKYSKDDKSDDAIIASVLEQFGSEV